MYRSEDVFAHHALVEHDGVLVVVTLPRHVCHQEVATECKFAVFRCITFGEDVTGLDALSLFADGTQVDGHVLVRTTELGNIIGNGRGVESAIFFVFRAIVGDDNLRSVYEINHTVALCRDHCAAIFADLLFNTRSDNRRFGMDERHGLAHHVRSHECAVSIVVFEEGDERSSDRSDLLRSHVHEFHFGGSDHGIVCILTALHVLANEGTVGMKRSVTLTDDLAFFLFGAEVNHLVVVEVRLVNVVAFFVFLSAVFDHAIGRLDESEIIDFRINAERGDQTDVRSFRAFNRAKTTVVRVVYVAHLETGTLTRKTTGAKCRKTTLVRNFGQRVGLVHELRKCVRTEERVDHTRNGLRVDQVGRSEHFVVAHIHAFADGTAHTCQTDRELVGELLANRTHTAVRKVVDVVDRRLRVDEFDEVLDDRDDVFTREYAHIKRGIETQFLIDTITTHFTEIITLVGEEKVVDHFARTRIIGGFCVTKLTVDFNHRLTFGVRTVLVERIEDDRVVGIAGFLVVEEHRRSTALDDLENILLVKNSFALEKDFATFDRCYFTRCFVDKVFRARLGHATGEFATDGLLQVGFVDLHFFG